ncbi:hypothetical protein [Williamsia sterculiae]|nr:hypothetical protein [Williamsia sterculiae]
MAATVIGDISTNIETLRSRQPVGRALVKRSFISQTANAFDVNGYSVPANQAAFFYLLFTGNNTQAFPYGVPYVAVYNGGTDSAHRLSDYLQVDSTGTGYSWEINGTYFGPNKVGWIIAIEAGSSGATVYMKVRTMTTCPGGWTMTW